ncbi:hypothetical protein RclHR1_05170004 [Rhizophagus clarus]|uniref:Uncharacterized protein n=1 Tax=Rhizophagus clarus TaxID=94130 RepID=A0A2Z6RM73_9GLOM|nr:hypothetical protein RclHR1_05170004 [Rhizophagus clarus]
MMGMQKNIDHRCNYKRSFDQLCDIETDLDEKNTRKFDEIKTYLTKSSTKLMPRTTKIYDKLLNIEGLNSFRHTRSNDEILTIREKLDHLERYLKILAPHILNITPVSGSNDSAFFKGSNEDDNLDDVFISQDQNCNHI